VLADEAGGVIAGHARILAARQLGYAEVRVMVARGWTDAQKRAYVIADNQLALNAGWDKELLGLELPTLFFGKLKFGLSEPPTVDGSGFVVEDASLKLLGWNRGIKRGMPASTSSSRAAGDECRAKSPLS
jgi:hypothetical protein